MIEFAYPYFFLLFLALPLYWWFYWQQQSHAKISFSMTRPLKQAPGRKLVWLQYLGLVMRSLALIMLICVLARPQVVHSESRKKTEGLDIMLTVDASGSMRALDFVLENRRYTRLDVAKKVIGDFIDKRTDDRLGMVVFGTNAFTVAPLTYDHEVLKFFLENVEIGIAGEKTAIGDSIATAVKRLKDLKAKDRVMIFLTDGENTAGKITPNEAIELAKTYKVKVYTIAMGRNGIVPILTEQGRQTRTRVYVDKELLNRIADETGGEFFSAETTEDLTEVYGKIDELEKTEAETMIYRHFDEKFDPFAKLAMVFLLFEVGFNLSRFKKLP